MKGRAAAMRGEGFEMILFPAKLQIVGMHHGKDKGVQLVAPKPGQSHSSMAKQWRRTSLLSPKPGRGSVAGSLLQDQPGHPLLSCIAPSHGIAALSISFEQEVFEMAKNPGLIKAWLLSWCQASSGGRGKY